MTWPLAIMLEEPDRQGDHVLFTHPRTWLRDLDPFARSRFPRTTAEKARDAHLWPGLELDYVMSLAQAAVKVAILAESFSLTRAQLYERVSLAGSDAIEVRVRSWANYLHGLPRWYLGDVA